MILYFMHFHISDYLVILIIKNWYENWLVGFVKINKSINNNNNSNNNNNNKIIIIIK